LIFVVPGAESQYWKTCIFVNKITGIHIHRYQHKYQQNILLGGFNSRLSHIRHILRSQPAIVKKLENSNFQRSKEWSRINSQDSIYNWMKLGDQVT